jgi:hypothetical protein
LGRKEKWKRRLRSLQRETKEAGEKRDRRKHWKDGKIVVNKQEQMQIEYDGIGMTPQKKPGWKQWEECTSSWRASGVCFDRRASALKSGEMRGEGEKDKEEEDREGKKLRNLH